ncbi:MAG: sigma-54-dependent Fis family transcriptional regulator [Deltaproteobacteria bacterium]|nr:MAG: sigma-54-dependent Fis family transcriptional regulator [Deltaproteobacteria bacterium]
MQHKILIVDDEQSILSTLKGSLEDEGFSTVLASTGENALKIIDSQEIDLVLLDVWLPGKDGLEVLKEIKKTDPGTAVVIMTGHGTIDTAVKALKLGAMDFIEKPLDLNKIIVTINNALRIKNLEEENAFLRKKTSKEDEIIGDSPAITRLKKEIELAAPSDAWVLILGENGSGKELVARRLHNLSRRADRPFVEVNCAAIPEELIESELLGHEKGSFTGATERKRGKFELADKGTLFLDEIGDMSLATQAKVLRVLQEQRFERVGGSSTIQVDVRVITATNKNLEKEIEQGRFREDLYYRLNVIPLYVPPLRERKQDIPRLVDHFLSTFAMLNDGKKKKITAGAIKKLVEHNWPGNVRELKNIVERMVIMTQGDTIKEENIPLFMSGTATEMDDLLEIASLKEARMAFERRFIERKLAQCGYNISKTADHIGLERSNLHRKIKGLGIDAQ